MTQLDTADRTSAGVEIVLPLVEATPAAIEAIAALWEAAGNGGGCVFGLPLRTFRVFTAFCGGTLCAIIESGGNGIPCAETRGNGGGVVACESGGGVARGPVGFLAAALMLEMAIVPQTKRKNPMKISAFTLTSARIESAIGDTIIKTPAYAVPTAAQ